MQSFLLITHIYRYTRTTNEGGTRQYGAYQTEPNDCIEAANFTGCAGHLQYNQYATPLPDTMAAFREPNTHNRGYTALC